MEQDKRTGKHAGPVNVVNAHKERKFEEYAREGELRAILDRRGRHMRDDYEERVNRSLRAQLYKAAS